MELARKLAFFLVWPAILLVVWGELTPYPPDVLPGASDKLLHFTAYFGLAGLAVTATGLRRASLFVLLGLILLGGTLEILQGYTGRDPEVMDEVANTIGAVLGAIVAFGLIVVLKPGALVAPTPRD
jgi:VanZ family protein